MWPRFKNRLEDRGKSRRTINAYADIMNRPLAISRSTQTCALGSAIAASVGSKREIKVPNRPRVSTIAADSSSR